MLLSTLKDQAGEQGLPLQTVAAEVLHIILLDVLFSQGESQAMAFQGGTATHLLHGGYRYSEDLDFAGEALTGKLAMELVHKSQSSVEKKTLLVFGNGSTLWKIPQPKSTTRVYTSWFHFRPAAERLTLRVKLEFAQFPVYYPEPLVVRSELDVLQRLSLINGLPARELLAEKITAVAGRRYVKGRDLFDLWYLTVILKTAFDAELTVKKFRDYGVQTNLTVRLGMLRDFSTEALAQEMNRFLPARYRRMLENDGFQRIRHHALDVVERAFVELEKR
jgi:predicted nucleotidyltransferase component of viral defense system